MSMTPARVPATDSSSLSVDQVLLSFQQSVIDRFQIMAGDRLCSYQEYLAIPESSDIRRGDEANAVDQQFTRYMLEWLGFSPADWTYNQPQPGTGKKLNRPDYSVRGSIGTAFIVEDKNSSIDFDNNEHLKQMRRYCLGTAGYAVWCNMRRLLAVRFVPGNALTHDVLVDIFIEEIFGPQPALALQATIQATNLALFQLLFSKDRFTRFKKLVEEISIDEQTFQERAAPLDTSHAIDHFIAGSRQTLNHLKLAAFAQIQEAISRNKNISEREGVLRREWSDAAGDFARRINYALISDPVLEAIGQLTPRLGELAKEEIRGIGEVVKQACGRTIGMARFSATLLPLYESWLERALHINSALLTQRFESANPFRIVEAYQIWSERQSDIEDVRPETFAEQVAYVFFVRLLLVRVLEDKRILLPRLASDGGFLEWSQYIERHFQELDGVSVLNEIFSAILARKASNYYLHFFQQAVFDWFNPDDYLLVETLEFLCRYNFQHINSDIIGFTYEAYIDRNARDRKGHFLTREDVVEYMLDLLEYSGPQIIGRRILDPACGSGSFLVHAARRYRKALVTYYCNTRGLPISEESLQSDPALRNTFASRYLQDLTTLFYGMELNPFACYLAEMNLLIQALDDLFALQQANEMQPIERFRVYNTDSLDLPREVLDRAALNTEEASKITILDRLSYRLTDEAYPIKASLNSYTDGFSYIVSNPPYVSSKQEELDTRRFRNAAFYKTMLSGDMNLYLLFLRLGLYYLAEYGQMIYIVPLTLLGDKSASAARKQLKTPPFSPSVIVRFYRGDILFPGVDQAVAIVRVNRSSPSSSILVSGGATIQEARAAQSSVPFNSVIEAVPQNHIWQGNWLVAQSQGSWDIWEHVKKISNNLTTLFEGILEATFERKQGDVNATYLNPLRVGSGKGSFSDGDIAIYKGEDVRPFAPLPDAPSDWARPSHAEIESSRETSHTSETLEQLKQIVGSEEGIVIRQVARLNTRERLIASWFERGSEKPFAFTNELWRMRLKDDISEEFGKASLAMIGSDVAAYLINLFSTNNHVSKEELGRIPIPDPERMPVTQLASLADALLSERAALDRDFVVRYGAKLPEYEDGEVYIPPSTFLAAIRLPKLSIAALVGRGEVKNNGPANGRIRSLRSRNLIVCAMDASNPRAASFAQVLELFLREPGRENETWGQAQDWMLPDPVAADSWLTTYRSVNQQAQAGWKRAVSLQEQIDEVVANWYGFDDVQRRSIRAGLPWARRHQ
jgi:Eco57I restriction-modification methylase